MTFIKCRIMDENPSANEDDLDAWESPVYSLEKGQYTTIEGTVSGVTGSSLTMKDCEILAID